MEQKKALILIGNGFDLSFGMKTSYKHFVESEYFKKIIPKNDLADYIYLSFADNDCKWVDVEMELAKYSSFLLEKGNIDNEKFKREFQELSDALKDYLKRHTGGNSNTNMQKLIQEWCNIEGKNIEVISFNYTHNVSLRFFNDNKITVNYIHGFIDNDIVLGVDEKSELIKEHEFLYKSYNPHIRTEGVLEKIRNADKYIIYGCSLGETDEFYFSNIFTKEAQNKSFYIYYYESDEEIKFKNRVKSLVGNMAEFKSNNKVEFINSKAEVNN